MSYTPHIPRWQYRRRLVHLACLSDMEATRFTLAISGLFWSIFLAWPGESFSRKTYWIMAEMAPEWLWAVAFGFQSTVMIYALLTGIRRRWIVWADAMLGSFLWTSSTLACYLAHWPTDRPFADALAVYAPPAAMSGEVGLMAASWWVLVRYTMPGDAVKKRSLL